MRGFVILFLLYSCYRIVTASACACPPYPLLCQVFPSRHTRGYTDQENSQVLRLNGEKVLNLEQMHGRLPRPMEHILPKSESKAACFRWDVLV